MRHHEQLPTWGDPVPPRIDWGLIRFCLVYVTALALVVHLAQGVVR